MIQQKEAYEGQCLIRQYDSEIPEDDEPRRNSTLAVAQLAVKERGEGHGAGNMKILNPGHRQLASRSTLRHLKP